MGVASSFMVAGTKLFTYPPPPSLRAMEIHILHTPSCVTTQLIISAIIIGAPPCVHYPALRLAFNPQAIRAGEFEVLGTISNILRICGYERSNDVVRQRKLDVSMVILVWEACLSAFSTCRSDNKSDAISNDFNGEGEVFVGSLASNSW